MATTTTYSLEKPTVGGAENTWGGDWNDNADKIDDLLDGTLAIKPNLDEGLWEVGGVAVTATAAELNVLDGITATTSALNTASTHYVPSGGIIMWSGSIASIPSGWYLCDGTNSTPDLRNRFIVGAGSTYAVDATGGADSVTLTQNQIPGHTHTFSGTTAGGGAHDHSLRGGFGTVEDFYGGSAANYGVGIGSEDINYKTASVGTHTHTFSGTTASTGGGTSHENRPPYYALAYIMKA